MEDGIELSEFIHDRTLPLKERLSHRFQPRKVIILSGPTAVGKSRLSMLIAKELGGEIISADSVQVYRGMDIGSAKASREEMEEIPHHLIDCREINEPFSVIQFYEECRRLIRDIVLRGKVPIIVGGTG